MAIFAEFIGIDKYDSPRIGDLNGAERDALALHALFTDSVPGLSAKLLLSKDATLENVERSLQETLLRATEEDVAIFYFAGHGAPDHRLVLSNSDPANHVVTTLAMDRIADAFKKTRARIAICMLDCCFSGGAPARVFTEIPLTRSNEDPTLLFEGKGRVLITASAAHEPAYEHPQSRHGLFTMALLEALQHAAADANLVTIMAEVQARVRAEAARLSIDQSPCLLGSVEGGLGFPKFCKGETYWSAFPMSKFAKVGASIGDLSLAGFPQVVLDRWTQVFPKGLNQLQLDAVNEHGLLQGKPLLAVAPTSAGKTFLGELAAVKTVIEGKKGVFLLPYKALVNEKFDQFTALYGESLGMRVIRCTGDYQDQTAEILKGKFDLALLTYEMFLNLVIANPHLLTQLGLVVVDEAQFITDPSRGISIELLLTMLLAARSRGIKPQLVCLSAVIGSVNSFDEWLGAEKLVRTDRPVALIEGVIDRSGTYQYRDEDGQIKEERLVLGIFQRREKPSAQDVIVPLVAKLVRDGEQVIVFRNQRGSAQGCARYLASDLGLAGSSAQNELPENDLSKASKDLRFCLQHGTAFHTSNLVKEERAIVERAFRDPKSNVRALAATTTVAAGINTPASTVIIAEQEFMGEDGRLFTVAEYKNMAGRAGRLGYKERGKCIIYAETPMERQRLFQKYVLGALEPINSSFKPSDLETWVLRLLAQVKQAKREEVPSLL
jgi:superfamily II DNA/RNA helicase